MITWEHFLHRIFKTFLRTFSSEMEYLALHLSQINFMERSLSCCVGSKKVLEKPLLLVRLAQRLGVSGRDTAWILQMKAHPSGRMGASDAFSIIF